MKTPLQRILAIVCGITLIMSAFTVASAATYPYDVQSADSVNLRKYASASSVVLAYIESGDTVTILGETGDYYKVRFGGVVGYAVKIYINGESLLSDPDYILNNLSAVTGYPYTTTTTARVSMRNKANDTASVVAVVPAKGIIKVSLVTSNKYAKVTYNGKSGYIHTDYVNLAPVATPTPVPEPTMQPGAEKYPVLRFGDTGTFVTALQEALAELKFYKSTVDGKYGTGTKAAVLAFEAKNKRTEDGIADQAMLYLLFEGTPKNASGSKKTVKTVPPIYGMTLEYGDKGELIKQLQTRLLTLGYYDGNVTGTFNTATKNALKAFQKKMGIKADGVATPDVQTILYSASARSASDIVTPTPAATATLVPPSGTVRKGDAGQDVLRVQQRLQTLGYYSGTLDGKYGNGTYQAVYTFQEYNFLTADGICGPGTIAVLFSGSAIYAGTVPTPTPTATTQVAITEDNVTLVEIGSVGTAVLNVQRRLFELGYYISRLDGVFLDTDMNAVKLFQQVNGLTVDGKAGYITQKLLFSSSALPAPADAGSEESTYNTLRYGDAGDEVAAMQKRLIALGYLSGDADGYFGLTTKTAVILFQKENNLARDGVAGSKTLEALYADSASSLDTSEILKQGMVSSSVRQMQEHLIALGYLSGSADGNFGPLTSLALIAFQKAQRLTADGIAGTVTLSALIKAADDKSASTAPGVARRINPANVRYANWYDEIRAIAKKYPNVTVYDFNTGISWNLTLFSFGAHADGYPTTAEDTAKLYEAFGGEVTWTPKPVWVVFSNGSVYMASTHDVAHGVDHNATNDFPGHLCVHFPRTAEEVAAIGPYATSHQKAIDLGWTATVAMAVQ